MGEAKQEFPSIHIPQCTPMQATLTKLSIGTKIAANDSPPSHYKNCNV